MMGSYVSAIWRQRDTKDDLGSSAPTRSEGGRKRSHENEELINAENALLHTPKKKKLRSTTDYIYQVLFIDGENSDVTISALNREWKLHKLYLKQCGYFESMFRGTWKESKATAITLDIPDRNIDADALAVAFGCLYRDDLTIEPIQVVPVVAAACLLQLDGLMQQCAAIMRETISSKTVCGYYDCSLLYGLGAVKDACFEWLENNIMAKQSKDLLKDIKSTLMQDLIKSPNLFVMQVEMDVYNLLKRWLFIQVMPWWTGSYKSGITKQAEIHFKDLTSQEFGTGSHGSFLETCLGKIYKKVFAELRFQHIIIDLSSTNLLFKDRIVPREWLMPFFRIQWLTMLNMEQGEDLGPKQGDVNEDVFLKSSLRCARILHRDVEHQWRWIGFNYGIDLVIMYIDRTIIIKRNCGNQSRLLSNQSRRYVMARVTVSSLNDLGQVTYTKTGDIVSHDLVRDGEVQGMSIDRTAELPLRIALNILYYTPRADVRPPKLLRIPLRLDSCRFCKKKTTSTAVVPTCTVSSEGSNPDLCPMQHHADNTADSSSHSSVNTSNPSDDNLFEVE
ncbi:germ cell-less protein-like 1 [Watersipora subatra]|uniref:germ cell-less protein-like 1 n=1 Tax=Watersipora subatra TaxID=2589382 RepID=UPI00355C3CAC